MSDYSAPSSLRIPVAVPVGLVLPPLGLVLWIALSGSQRRDYVRSNWVRSGVAIVLGSALPLVLVGIASALGLLSDPNPNPIGLGLLLVAGGGLGTVLSAIGIVIVSRGDT